VKRLGRALPTLLVVAVALVVGARSAARAPLDVFPDFVPPSVSIQTEAPGLAPEQVEQLVTDPIERLVNASPGLASLRSESIPGLSVVNLTFAEGVDVHAARQQGFGQGGRQSGAGGQVFAVGDDQIDGELAAQFREDGLDRLAARFTDDVADDQAPQQRGAIGHRA